MYEQLDGSVNVHGLTAAKCEQLGGCENGHPTPHQRGGNPGESSQHRVHPALRLPPQPCGWEGVIKALRKVYPQANVTAVDYDPGTSEVNQLNRIKLMLSNAVHAMETNQTP